ncbi:GNAT family N-acetyltransferase [Actinomadura flavalba]|uniref:GNAT family N-acetyltransferase n=1 Tax=Actinomadura flavalba TaxID=1120938 RepID=UPI000362C397|nr:GNAT family N-acetyltransferase [Actinomadura flavalba]
MSPPTTAPPSGLTVRTARPDEYAAVGALTVDVYVGGGYMNPESTYIATLRDTAARAATTEILVAELGGTLVGAVAYCPPESPLAELAGPDDGEFRMLAVLPSAQGRGAGSALVRACVERARAAGLRGVRLSTQPNMTAAHRLYERLGFHRTPDDDWSPVPGLLLVTYALAF